MAGTGKGATTIGGMCRNKSRLQVLVVLVAVFMTSCLVTGAQANDNLRVAYQWKQMDFNYPSAAARANAIATGAFVPENVIPVGLEVYKTRLFMTLPRWKSGVPASLVYIDMAGIVWYLPIYQQCKQLMLFSEIYYYYYYYYWCCGHGFGHISIGKNRHKYSNKHTFHGQ